MPANRFFLNTSFNEKAHVLLEGSEWHHMVRVMRVELGDRVELINGQGALAVANVLEHRKKSSLLVINSLSFTPPDLKLGLAQSLVRSSKLKLVIEKGTELGVTDFYFFLADGGEVKVAKEKQKWQEVAMAALKQCGRLHMPRFHVFNSLDESLNKMTLPAFYLDTSDNAPLLKNCVHVKEATFFVGPERGFTEQERALFASNTVQGISIHENILRTETAGFVALSIFSHQRV